MRFIDDFAVAFQNLIRQKARTFLTISAVVIGAVSVIIMVSIVQGAKAVFVNQLQSIGGLSLISISGDASSSGGDSLFNNNNTGSSDAKKIDAAAIASI